MQKVLAGIFLFTLSAMAVQAAEVRIGYVDLQSVITLSKAGKAEKAKIETFIKKRQGELKEDEKKLTDLQKKLEKESLTMSKEQKSDAQKKFRQQVEAYQKRVVESDKEVKRKEALFTQNALKKLRDIVADIARDEKFTFVVERNESGLLYAEEGLDLTEKVREVFDKKYSK